MNETSTALIAAQQILYARLQQAELLRDGAFLGGRKDLEGQYQHTLDVLRECHLEVYKLWQAYERAATPAAPETPQEKE